MALIPLLCSRTKRLPWGAFVTVKIAVGINSLQSVLDLLNTASQTRKMDGEKCAKRNPPYNRAPKQRKCDAPYPTLCPLKPCMQNQRLALGNRPRYPVDLHLCQSSGRSTRCMHMFFATSPFAHPGVNLPEDRRHERRYARELKPKMTQHGKKCGNMVVRQNTIPNVTTQVLRGYLRQVSVSGNVSLRKNMVLCRGLLVSVTIFTCCACDQESTQQDGEARMRPVPLKNLKGNQGEDMLIF